VEAREIETIGTSGGMETTILRQDNDGKAFIGREWHTTMEKEEPQEIPMPQKFGDATESVWNKLLALQDNLKMINYPHWEKGIWVV
jgi:hypothetical protein